MFACTAGLGLEDIIHKFKEVRQEVSTSPPPLAAYHAVPLWQGLPLLLSADPLHNCVYCRRVTITPTSWLRLWQIAWQRRLLRSCTRWYARTCGATLLRSLSAWTTCSRSSTR